MTQSPSNLKAMHDAITDLWKVFKKHLENPPHTEEEWVKAVDDFSNYCGRDPFKIELATSCYRELMRIDGQTVTAERGWMNG